MILKILLSLCLTFIISGCATKYTNTLSNKVLSGQIFTYKFDPDKPQVDSGVNGTLVEQAGCLLIQAPAKSILITPILPGGISKWDRSNNTVYIKDKIFKIGDPITINGVFIHNMEDKRYIKDNFQTSADNKCLKDSWVLIGTH